LPERHTGTDREMDRQTHERKTDLVVSPMMQTGALRQTDRQTYQRETGLVVSPMMQTGALRTNRQTDRQTDIPERNWSCCESNDADRCLETNRQTDT